MPRKRAKNGLKIHWISKKLLRLYVNTLRLMNFVHFQVFCKILAKIFLQFWLIIGQRIDSSTPEAFFSIWECPKKISAQNSNFEQIWLQRHLVSKLLQEKKYPWQTQEWLLGMKSIYVVFFWPALSTVADLFKPTVC